MRNVGLKDCTALSSLSSVCIKGTFLLLLFMLIISLPQVSGANDSSVETTIKSLLKKLNKDNSPKSKAQTYVFLARNYSKKGDIDEAISNYQSAISLNNAAWIWLEMGRFSLKVGKYKQAKIAAETLIKEFPHFSPKETARLNNKVTKLLEEKQLEDNPPEILFDTVAEKQRDNNDRNNQNNSNKTDIATSLNVPGNPNYLKIYPNAKIISVQGPLEGPYAGHKVKMYTRDMISKDPLSKIVSFYKKYYRGNSVDTPTVVTMYSRENSYNKRGERAYIQIGPSWREPGSNHIHIQYDKHIK